MALEEVLGKEVDLISQISKDQQAFQEILRKRCGAIL